MKKAFMWIIFMVSVMSLLGLYLTGVFPVVVEGEAQLFNRILRYFLYFVFGMSALFSAAYIIADEPERKHRRSRRPRRR